MRHITVTPSMVPGTDATVYLVLDDFGKLGRAYRETDVDECDRVTVIHDLLSGQFERPVKVVAFNTAEGWSRDVSEDIARAVIELAAHSDRTPSRSAREFYERHTGESVPRELVDG